MSCGECKAPLPLEEGRLWLRVLADRTTLEIFGNEGSVYMPVGRIFPDSNRSLSLQVTGGAARVRSLLVFEPNAAWHSNPKTAGL